LNSNHVCNYGKDHDDDAAGENRVLERPFPSVKPQPIEPAKTFERLGVHGNGYFP
jgi:hypothetical protein